MALPSWMQRSQASAMNNALSEIKAKGGLGASALARYASQGIDPDRLRQLARANNLTIGPAAASWQRGAPRGINDYVQNYVQPQANSRAQYNVTRGSVPTQAPIPQTRYNPPPQNTAPPQTQPTNNNTAATGTTASTGSPVDNAAPEELPFQSLLDQMAKMQADNAAMIASITKGFEDRLAAQTTAESNRLQKQMADAEARMAAARQEAEAQAAQQANERQVAAANAARGGSTAEFKIGQGKGMGGAGAFKRRKPIKPSVSSALSIAGRQSPIANINV